MDVNQPLPWFFTRWPREDSFSVSWPLGRICRRFSRFCNILPQDLTPLVVKITRRKNLLSVSQRKLKLSTHLHTVSYNHISFLNRSQLVWVLASSGFYSITWRTISSKIHFRKQRPFRGNFNFLFSVWYLLFLWIYTSFLAIQSSTAPVFSYIK